MQLNGIEPISILRAAERFRMNNLFATAQWSVVTKQFILGVSTAVVIGFAYGATPAKSVAAGVLCIALPSAYFAWVSQRTSVGSRILAQGVVKMLSSCAVMALFLGFEKVGVAWFLLGLVVGQSAYVWVLAIGSREHAGRG
jgi:hypothetical protein